MCATILFYKVSFLSEQFPTPSLVALLHDIVQYVCPSKFEPQTGNLE